MVCPVTTLTTYVFPSPATAPRLARRLEPLRERGLPIGDAAVLQWADDEQHPTAWQTDTIHDRGALSGAFWGLLFAHLFLLPLSHVPSAGRQLDDEQTLADHTLADHTLAHIGIGHSEMHSIRFLVTPGSSALFVVAGGPATGGDEPRRIHSVTTAIARSLSGLGAAEHQATVIALTPAQTERLYTAFGRHPTR